MRQLCTLAMVLLLAMLFFGCEAKEVKPVSPASKMATDAFELAEVLRKAYTDKDMDSIESNVTPEVFSMIRQGMKPFQDAELTFTPTWVDITDSTVNLTVSWKGTWKMNEKVIDDRGLSVFVFEGTPLKLSRIQRSNPFNPSE